MQPREMADYEIRAELATVDETSQRYAELQAEMEERVLARRAERRAPTWHPFDHISEGT